MRGSLTTCPSLGVEAIASSLGLGACVDVMAICKIIIIVKLMKNHYFHIVILQAHYNKIFSVSRKYIHGVSPRYFEN